MSIKQPVFVASCVFTREYPELGKKVFNYVAKRFSMPVMRCCVANYKTKEFEDAMPQWLRPEWSKLPAYIDISHDNTMVYICHNCSAIFQEQRPEIPILSFWELVLLDEGFKFADYSKEKITVQDCWRSRDNQKEQDAVRTLLKKMNFEIVELEESRENTEFCGISLYSPAPERNLKLAPRRFVENAVGKFVPHSADEQKELMESHCAKITTDKVVTYCHYCTKGIQVGGKTSLHLAELIMPS